MKSHIITLFIALVAGFTGSYIHQNTHTQNSTRLSTENTGSNRAPALDNKPEDIRLELEQLRHRVHTLETELNKRSQKKIPDRSTDAGSKTDNIVLNRHVSPNKENLLAAGVSPDIADDALRRISQQEFKRLQLQNLIQRGGPEIRRYRDELRELNKNRISLRSELGDTTYDQYLYESGQNNRVRVSSVMSGSPAELSGLQPEDVLLYYDNQKILNWSDIRAATIQGEIGSYTSVEILRDGSRMTLMIPRGTLGIELDAMQLNPAE